MKTSTINLILIFFSFFYAKSHAQTSCLDSLPISVNFNDETTFNSSGSHFLNNCWIAGQSSSSSSINWRVHTGATPTSATGPSKGHVYSIFHSWNENYIYLESSGSSASIGDSATFYSPVIYVDSTSNPNLSFWYHMFGSNMGSLQVDVFDGTAWYYKLWEAQGQQQLLNTSNYLKAFVDLGMFAGDSIIVQFKGKIGNTTSDIAIDDIVIQEKAPCATPSNFKSLNIQSAQVSLSWTNATGSSNSRIIYGTHGFKPDSNSQFIDTNSNNVILYNLAPGRHYDIYLVSTCALGFSDTLGPISLVTPCSSYTIPYHQDFSQIPTNLGSAQFSLIDCWTGVSSNMVNSNQLTSPVNYPIAAITRNWYGNNPVPSLFINSAFNFDTTVISSPPIIGLDSGNIELSFTASHYSTCFDGENQTPDFTGTICYGSQGNLIVGTTTDPNDLNAFMPFDTIILKNAPSNFSFYLDSAHGNAVTGTHIAFSYSNETNWLEPQYIFITDISVKRMPKCPKPKNINAFNPTDSTIDISLLSTGSSFIIQWDTASFVLGNGNNDTATSSNFTLFGLSPGVIYHAYIQNNCLPNDSVSGWVGPVEFKTQCGNYTLPYFEDFSVPPMYVNLNDLLNSSCWGSTRNNVGNLSLIRNDYNGNGKWLSFGQSSYNGSQTNFVFSPRIEELVSNHNQLSFIANSGYANTNLLIVGTMTNPSDTNTFHPLDTILIKKTSKKHVVYLDSSSLYNGLDQHIAFTSLLHSTNHAIFLDDIEVRQIDSCFHPLNPRLVSKTTNSATIEWDSKYGQEFILQIGLSGMGLGGGSLDTSYSTQHAFTNLQSGTFYDYYILNNCPTATSSDWVGPFSFSTHCNEFSTPYTENFDAPNSNGKEAPLCWTYQTNPLSISNGTVYQSNGLSRSNSNSYYILMWHNVPLKDTVALISPKIKDLTNADKMMSLYIKGGSGQDLYVASFGDPDDITTMNIIDTISRPNYFTGYINYEIFIDSASGYNFTDSYLGVVAIKALNTISETFIDDIEIKDIPHCYKPRKFTLESATTTSASFSWETTYGSSFELAYGLKGFDPDSAVVAKYKKGIIHLSDTLTGLTHNTVYDVYLKDSCNSEWVGPITFNTSCGGPIKGLYTIRGTPGPKNFTSIAEAIQALKGCGIDSSVVFQLAAGNFTGNYNLGKITGADSLNTITFIGSGHLQSMLLNNTPNVAIFDLLKTEYVRFENIFFDNWDYMVVKVRNTKHVEFTKCYFKAHPTNYACIEANNSRYLTIKNNEFEGANVNLQMGGNWYSQIDSNIFKNTHWYGIVSGHSFFDTFKQNTFINCGIQLYNPYRFAIEENNIQNAPRRGIWVRQQTYWWGYNYPIDVAGSRITNNMVTSAWEGIYSYYLDNVVITNNSVNAASGLVVQSSKVSAKNNILAGNTPLDAFNYGSSVFDYNIYFSASSTLVRMQGDPFFDLAGLQSSFTTQNIHSLEGDPIFYSATDLHVKGPLANDMGDNTSSPSHDIDGDIRPSPFAAHVDIGADEFDIANIDLNTVSILIDSTFKCEGYPIQVEAEIYNNGMDTIHTANFDLLVFGQTLTVQKNPSLPPFTSDTILIGTTVNALPGTQGITLIGSVLNDTIQANDTAFAEIYVFNNETINVTINVDSICPGDSVLLKATNFTSGSFIWTLNNDTIANTSSQGTFWTKPIYSNEIIRVYHNPGVFECTKPDTSINIYTHPYPNAQFSYVVGLPDTSSLTVDFNAGSSSKTDSVYLDFGDGHQGHGSPIIHTYTANGTYQVTLYAYNDCGEDSIVQAVLVQGIGIQESLLKRTLNVYPNPNEGEFRIAFTVEGIQPSEFTLFSLAGDIVYFEQLGRISGNIIKDVHINNLAPGVYILRVLIGEESVHKRITIH
ncbi:MAG: PKD domain-containing protein [Schleiferiaceae bacterium]|nr:PKD domain-containing protein [Schleiferiaceae bacterium]